MSEKGNVEAAPKYNARKKELLFFAPANKSATNKIPDSFKCQKAFQFERQHTSRCWKRAAAVARPAAATKGAALRNADDDDDRTVLVAAAENCRRVDTATACRPAARTAAEANIIFV